MLGAVTVSCPAGCHCPFCYVATGVQPLPVVNDAPAIADLVLADIRARDEFGASKYGTRLQPHNGRDALMDAYQEALDLVFYLRQALEERALR